MGGEKTGGPLLTAVVGIHGNEPAGVQAAQEVLEILRRDLTGLQGRFQVIVGNRRALGARRRFLRRDLNRRWSEERLDELESFDDHLEAEDAEMLELSRELEDVLDWSGPRYLMDLHTTSAPGPAFALFDDQLDNRKFAMNFPVPLVIGFEEELEGTLLDFLADDDVVTFGFESGQHDDPHSVTLARAALWIGLEASGVIARGSRYELDEARGQLRATSSGLPDVVEVRYRHPVEENDGFVMNEGYGGFERLEVGQIVAHDSRGPVTVPEAGQMLMPLYQSQGEDGFFIVRRVRKVWLHLSALLRRAGLIRVVHWLPGIKRHPGLSHSYVVNRKVARFYALEILHLLGFRRHRSVGERIIVTRRDRIHSATGDS